MPAAIPFIVMAASSAASAYAAHKQSEQAQQGADMTKGLIDKQSALASQLQNFAGGQISTAKPAQDAAMKYYMGLGTGDRGQIQSLLAPQINQMTGVYSGAQRGIEAHVGAGPQRDQAISDLAKQRAGQLGVMPMQARTDAMGKLADLGGQGMNRALSAYNASGSALTGSANPIAQYTNLVQQGNQGWEQFGQHMFNTWGPYLMKAGQKGPSQQQSTPGPWASGYQF